ncbi:molecular chaperone HtpG [Halochromatium salexigens]|uniref:Chaperone protein HtpG n=1 Tax=Halochromatium salexigens TaxID=49447 RepID=A0AAJ0UEL8_HALSE|nr:molecular chaperone HtpG [Halochromatium salexigens]MBK5930027.1 molecular chaperone HtpG [Halochromatium salexigens]
MTVDAHKETLEFKAEVSQVLDLVIRSLYSNKEIFLRELISNASDAAEKLRFESLTDEQLLEDDPNLRVRVLVDKDAGTVTVSDNGIGINRQEMVDTIGSIASSGTRQFADALRAAQGAAEHGEAEKGQAAGEELIGQFGVGFYSSFIVAERVSVISRRAGLSAEHGVCWQSEGHGRYTLETIEKASRGTDVVLHLKEEEKEFLDPWRLRTIIGKFSDHIAMPVEMLKEDLGGDEDEEKQADKAPEFEQVNRGTALWMRNKAELSDDDYKAFYKHISHDFEEPLAWAHNRVEGTNEYTALLYLPKRAPWDMWDREQKHGVKLYVRRVFIMDEADKLMPHWLRFVKGVVDSDDLPLNVSREILQHDRKIDTIRGANTKRVLSLLESLAKDEPEKYQTFWNEFGRVLKEGPAEDFANRERIGGLLRFASTHNETDEQSVSLDAYIERMKDGQKDLYYITADSPAAARHSPHLEVFRKKGVEVLLLSDRVDEWLVSNLHEYQGKHLQSVTKGKLDLGDLADKEEQEKAEQAEKEHEDLLKRLKDSLGERIEAVRVSTRLVDSPACIVVGEHEMSANLARVLKAVGQETPSMKPTLEVNLDHPLVRRLEAESDQGRFDDLSLIVLDQATLAEGGQLDDPSAFVGRLNKLMMNMFMSGA